MTLRHSTAASTAADRAAKAAGTGGYGGAALDVPEVDHPGDRPGVYRRRVSPTEWLYLAARRLGPGMVLQLVVEGEGTLDTEELRAAVATAARACPGSRLVRDGRIWRDSGLAPRVRVVGTPAPGPVAGRHSGSERLRIPGSLGGAEAREGTEAGAGAEAVVGAESAEALRGPLDPDAGPSCEVVLLPGAPGRPTTLAFRVFHGVMDGHGALIWATEIFRALRGEDPRPAHSTETDYALLAQLRATGRRPTLLLDQPSPLATTDPQAGPTARGVAARNALWRRRTLPGHHPALTARLAQALADATAVPARIMIPVDLRRHRPDVSSTANLTLPVFLRLNAREDWRTAQAQLLRALNERRELAGGFESGLARLPLAVSAALLRAGRAVSERHGRHLASAIVSHLGRIDLAACSGPGFTATSVYALPVHAPLVPVSCVAVETAVGTELTVGFQGGGDLAARADALLDGLVAALGEPAAAASTTAVAAARSTTITAAAPAASPPQTTVVRLFRDQAARTPCAPALVGPEGEVSYAELDRSSDAVAAELLRRGIASEARIGLVVERSPAGVAALWGILKAGAAYVPLDPHHPDARIGQVLGDAGVTVCLTQRHLHRRIAAAATCPVVAMEDIPDDPAPGVRLPEPAPESLAYIIHTSGSTGRPKGVQIEHGSLAGFLRWAAELCRIDATTRFAFLSSYAFDITCFPVFLPLLAGGAVVLLPGEPTRTALQNVLHEGRVNTVAVTPSHLDLIERFDLAPGNVRTLLIGGEQFTVTAADRARRRFGADCRIVNAYGPTEATVACLAHVLDGTEPGPAVPIGHPGPYAQVELMASAGRRVGLEEAGMVGEIVVSGIQLARGYLGRPDLDAERFVVGEDGVRRYRTGDLGRRLPDGGIEFVGRTDDQIKIAGHRIEPAEIETALEGHPAVRRAAVTVRTRPDGAGPTLCAYVVEDTPEVRAAGADNGALRADAGPVAQDPGQPSPSTTAAELGAVLREYLATQLPAYLVPAAVLPVADLPSTVSGKVDFAALPDPYAGVPDRNTAVSDPSTALPDPSTAPSELVGVPSETVAAPAASPTAGTDPGPPMSAVEDRVAGIWSRILQVDRRLLGRAADFTQLGGDSLAVLEMLSAVASEVLDPGQEAQFMDELEHLVDDLTLERVCAAVGLALRRRTEADV
ncbi:amino acid adenylation domain-containing protein [Streptomyces sp. KR80]|uniref:amino acid adenylation domain-containing protein n=1 Tax=Streptomyces sp. KR80 TaxID=3457426 RepID=UPI003FD1CEB7